MIDTPKIPAILSFEGSLFVVVVLTALYFAAIRRARRARANLETTILPYDTVAIVILCLLVLTGLQVIAYVMSAVFLGAKLG